jgi:hypothetical protein
MQQTFWSAFLALAFLTTLLSGCAPAPASIPAPTVIPPTITPLPTDTPIPTNTPEPTSTAEPSPTPIVLPGVINETFSGVSITHRETFQYVIQNAVPQGWQTDQQYAIWVTEGNQLKAQPLPSSVGTVFFYSGEIITPRKGVFLTFKYSGSQESFTLGFDNVTANGERIHGTDFRSVAMEARTQNPIVYGNFGGATAKGAFKGNLRLQQNTWYNIVLAFDKNQDYIIKIWQPDDPKKQLTYVRNWKDFPDKYYFISWVNSKRSLLIDDFTIFEFDEIIQK